MMNCDFIAKNSPYHCVPVVGVHGERALEISTAFSYADGTAITFYIIEQNDGHVLLSDNGETLLHLSSQGFNLSKHSITSLRNRVAHFGVMISEDGDFQLISQKTEVNFMMPIFIESLLVITQWEREHIALPEKSRNVVQEAEVLLRAWKPNEKLVSNPKIKGRSNLEFVFNFKQGNDYIDVISPNNISTGSVLRKVVDVKNGSYFDDRNDKVIIIIDDRENKESAEHEKDIITSLSGVILFSDLENKINNYSSTLIQ